jgi:hypothetical protein
VGSVCHIKQFRLGGKHFAGDKEVEMEVAETTVKRLLSCRFQHTGKTMGQVYQCWWRSCREINVFSRFKYHMLHVLYQFVTHLLTVPHKYQLHYKLLQLNKWDGE